MWFVDFHSYLFLIRLLAPKIVLILLELLFILSRHVAMAIVVKVVSHLHTKYLKSQIVLKFLPFWSIIPDDLLFAECSSHSLAFHSKLILKTTFFTCIICYIFLLANLNTVGYRLNLGRTKRTHTLLFIKKLTKPSIYF